MKPWIQNYYNQWLDRLDDVHQQDYVYASHTPFPRLTAFLDLCADDFRSTLCKWFGHGKHLDASLRFPDSGGELLFCRRCGWSHQVWHQ